jgi:hypothetical protein
MGTPMLKLTNAVFVAVFLVITMRHSSRHAIVVEAILCYQCNGRTGDGSCGTPFNENGIETCEAKACLTTRILKQMKQGWL